MNSALVMWTEAGRVTEHLAGLHDQKSHGRRFNVPGDPGSGLRELAKRTSGRKVPAKPGGDGLSVTAAAKALDRQSSTTGRRPRAAPAATERLRTQADRERVQAAQAAAVATHGPAIAAAFRRVNARMDPDPTGKNWVGLADLRAELPDVPREQLDDALRGLLDNDGVRIIPVANTKSLKPRDRQAALLIGDTPNHAVLISDAALSRIGGTRRAAKASPAKAAPVTGDEYGVKASIAAFRYFRSYDDIVAEMRGVRGPRLEAMRRELNLPRGTAGQVRRMIVEYAARQAGAGRG